MILLIFSPEEVAINPNIKKIPVRVSNPNVKLAQITLNALLFNLEPLGKQIVYVGIT
jgi:hypothetical protein